MGREISTDRDTARRRLLRDAVVTIAALLLVFAAFDDITTDSATSFPLEYTILAASAVWLLFIAVRLMRRGHGLLGGISLLALASAVWGQRAIGPGRRVGPARRGVHAGVCGGDDRLRLVLRIVACHALAGVA